VQGVIVAALAVGVSFGFVVIFWGPSY